MTWHNKCQSVILYFDRREVFYIFFFFLKVENFPSIYSLPLILILVVGKGGLGLVLVHFLVFLSEKICLLLEAGVKCLVPRTNFILQSPVSAPHTPNLYPLRKLHPFTMQGHCRHLTQHQQLSTAPIPEKAGCFTISWKTFAPFKFDSSNTFQKVGTEERLEN